VKETYKLQGSLKDLQGTLKDLRGTLSTRLWKRCAKILQLHLRECSKRMLFGCRTVTWNAKITGTLTQTSSKYRTLHTVVLVGAQHSIEAQRWLERLKMSSMKLLQALPTCAAQLNCT
jgi:hypothetical protein